MVDRDEILTALRQLLNAIAAEVDMDSVGPRLGKAVNHAEAVQICYPAVYADTPHVKPGLNEEPRATAAARNELACAFYRQQLEKIAATDFSDNASVHAAANRTLEQCEDGKLLLRRFRNWVERAELAEAQLKAIAPKLALCEQLESIAKL